MRCAWKALADNWQSLPKPRAVSGSAKLFAEHGYDLVIVAADGGIDSAAETLRSLGPIVESVQTDLATREGVERLWQRVQALGRPVDAVAINAGVGEALMAGREASAWSR